MPQMPFEDLRQIKWILSGILVCLIVIAGVLAPWLLLVALGVGLAYCLAIVALRVAPAATDFAHELWCALSSLRRR